MPWLSVNHTRLCADSAVPTPLFELEVHRAGMPGPPGAAGPYPQQPGPYGDPTNQYGQYNDQHGQYGTPYGAPADPYGGFPAVYVDGVRLGELGMLQSIPVSAVVEIRYLRASAAAHELGVSQPGGVLVVSTRR